MRPKVYQLLEQCVEYGIERGWNRAHKHTESPTEEQIKEQIHSCIMGDICDWFEFEEGKSGETEIKGW